MDKDEKLIPPGGYCYIPLDVVNEDNKPKIKILTCPYWSLSKDHLSQENGYCAFMEEGDWDYPGAGLLWDQVKECGCSHDDFDIPEEEIVDYEKEWLQYMLEQGKVSAERIELVKKRISET